MSRAFINFLKKNPNTRKIFGKRELEIIIKQLQGIKLVQSEKNRLSRDIRKKFEFIKEISRYNFDFDLKKGSTIKSLVEDMKSHILESKYFPRIKRIVLFGSTAVNQRTIRSDIDIAVEFDSIDLKEATEFRIKFNYDGDIDVQVYNVLPEKIKSDIDKFGKIIWKRTQKTE